VAERIGYQAMFGITGLLPVLGVVVIAWSFRPGPVGAGP